MSVISSLTVTDRSKEHRLHIGGRGYKVVWGRETGPTDGWEGEERERGWGTQQPNEGLEFLWPIMMN